MTKPINASEFCNWIRRRRLVRILGPGIKRRFTEPPRVLFVCTANICRSPMAEAVLRKLLMMRRFPAAVDSAGITDYYVDMPPHPWALSTAKRRGYNTSHIVSRQISESDFMIFDVIVAMDRGVRNDLWQLAPFSRRAEIRLLLEFATLRRGRDVPDPYGYGPGAFERALDLIEDGCAGLAEHLRGRRVVPPPQ